MNKQFIRVFGVALMCAMLALAGCSKSDSGQAEDAQAQLQKANDNLKQAQEKVEKAKERVAEQQSANDDIAEAKAEKKAAEKKLAEARAEKKEASEQQTEARAQSDQATQQARAEQRQEAESHNKPVCADCGTISSITPIQRNVQHGSGVGAVAGGVAGGLLGSQIGSGTGKTIAEIAGALGGAYAGNMAEKHIRKVTVYKVNVAMDAGGTRSVTLDSADSISAGTRVRVQGNNLALLH